MSSQTPLCPGLAPVVRQAVLRAISCEVAAKEGPVLFASPHSSSVLSYTFSLRDVRARGGRRQYALLLVSRDRHHLAAHWPLLRSAVGAIVGRLQGRAEAKYQADLRAAADLREKCEYIREAPVSRRRASLKASRGLAEVTADAEVFERLHQDLVAVLAMAERCVSEQVVSGPPLASSVRGAAAAGPPLQVVGGLRDQLAPSHWRTVLYRLLSGQMLQVRELHLHLHLHLHRHLHLHLHLHRHLHLHLHPHLHLHLHHQVRGSSRPLARAACHGLTILLPHNLAASSTCFANLLAAGPELELEGPGLEVAEGPAYTFACPHPSPSCSGCTAQHSTIVDKLARILAKVEVPEEVQEVWLRVEVERLVGVAATFHTIQPQHRTRFLASQHLLLPDAHILTFFDLFS